MRHIGDEGDPLRPSRGEDGHPAVDTPGLTTTRILQNPLGTLAPPGHPGDLVKITDGRASIYMEPRDYDRASPEHLRWLLAAKR
jgi:hypothetical protein